MKKVRWSSRRWDSAPNLDKSWWDGDASLGYRRYFPEGTAAEKRMAAWQEGCARGERAAAREEAREKKIRFRQRNFRAGAEWRME